MEQKPTFELTPDVLLKSSLERLVAGSNYKRQWTIAFIEDRPEFGMKANATLVRVEPYIVAPYTGRAHFQIDRLADGVPFGLVKPTKTLVPRTILIKQITASEIVQAHGIGGRIYVGVESNPLKTTALVDRLNELYKLGIVAADVLEQEILDGASCIQFRFHPKSLGFTGAFLVDLYTPIDSTPSTPEKLM